MEQNERFTKILFVGVDEASFHVWRCMVNVLESLPPVELVYASDAEEALTLVDECDLDVIVVHDAGSHVALDVELVGRLYDGHPPVLVPRKEESERSVTIERAQSIYYYDADTSLASVHKTLLLATSVASTPSEAAPTVFH